MSVELTRKLGKGVRIIYYYVVVERARGEKNIIIKNIVCSNINIINAKKKNSYFLYNDCDFFFR